MFYKSYHWKVLSEDGLLKEPVHTQRIYSYDYMNNSNDGYKTEEEAVADLENFTEKNEIKYGEYFLVTRYRTY